MEPINLPGPYSRGVLRERASYRDSDTVYFHVNHLGLLLIRILNIPLILL